ncbi:SMC-Scp complex subunit ScpB [Lactiplantibacillus mudanjiangensis]|uniref:Segregation and condensation protein B n=1 Tax=Lactiplantibacillus mudanjiangensis TaxID=1296538 RepID=A0A660E3V4_9LACO|nr:SMC-Scp complex subunit ScpB [Lactiplantibacillus mudanjiangensis]VDG20511.1 transcription regulator (putative) [Lactobacillus plantarum JDM1] [Lactiplantibacillus mudanjiangensis]VDG24263.1 transcription regulator (putative) [Lactobacillus plantarum JDM1] [Lactiplantibacillus mudanjiangensis]VDG30474.1 transcription regulator (putative) [Lactobacillus plantarum JDM1] [Lactiplantibacillus mudanjiangensis]VDG30751.1 transcription regulator (putative) [Lactobacillus plantarum JDM1] [Lactiplant
MTNIEQIEALLFVAGDEGITVAEIENATGFAKPAITTLVTTLATKYEQDTDCALVVLSTANTYRLATKATVAPVLKKYFEAPLTTSLSQASLEVLAIIAYRQPLTRIEIDEIRGVQSGSTIQKLVLRQLVTETGRLNEPGRPILYGTTELFLDYFGLKSLDDLPAIDLAALTDTENPAPETDLFLTAFQDKLQGAVPDQDSEE